MSEAEFLAAVSAGYDAVAEGHRPASASVKWASATRRAAAAIAAALFGGAGLDWVGRGTGVDDAGLKRKAAVVDAGDRASWLDALTDPLAVLARSAAASSPPSSAPRSPRASTTCAAAPRRLRLHRRRRTAWPASPPAGLAHALAAHASAEAGHRRLLERLALKPLLDLGMRLGEASGAALAINIVRSALACHAGMATFAEASVSEK